MFGFRQVMLSPDEGAAAGTTAADTNVNGVSTDQVNAQQQQQAPGWIAALPDEFKANEFVKGFQKPGDFVKTALEIKAKHEALEAKTAAAIFKPGENATAEERSAFMKAMGVPEKPEDYKFTGENNDPAMVEWAKGTFHAAELTTEQAEKITSSWNGFMEQLGKAQEEQAALEVKAADDALKAEWKGDYDKNIELTRRGYAAFEKLVPGFKELVETKTAGGVAIGNDPRMLKVFNEIGKAIGDDWSFPSAPAKSAEQNLGFASIYKTPNPVRG